MVVIASPQTLSTFALRVYTYRGLQARDLEPREDLVTRWTVRVCVSESMFADAVPFTLPSLIVWLMKSSEVNTVIIHVCCVFPS